MGLLLHSFTVYAWMRLLWLLVLFACTVRDASPDASPDAAADVCAGYGLRVRQLNYDLLKRALVLPYVPH